VWHAPLGFRVFHYSSSHPYHTKKAIPFSFALRGQCLNSTTYATETYNQRLQEPLVNRGYPPNLVTKQIRRASSHIQPTQTPNSPSLNSSAIITQFHPKLTKVEQILHSHFHILQPDPDTRSVHPDLAKLRLAFQHPPNLRNILVRTNSSSPPPQTGVHICKIPRCRTCSVFIASPTVTINAAGGWYALNTKGR